MHISCWKYRKKLNHLFGSKRNKAVKFQDLKIGQKIHSYKKTITLCASSTFKPNTKFEVTKKVKKSLSFFLKKRSKISKKIFSWEHFFDRSEKATDLSAKKLQHFWEILKIYQLWEFFKKIRAGIFWAFGKSQSFFREFFLLEFEDVSFEKKDYF